MDILRSQRGFTVAELLVVIAVIGFLLAAVLLSRDDSRGQVELTNIASEAALMVRTAQTMGSNGRMHVDATFPNGRTVPHGVVMSPDTNNIRLFVDENISLSYSSGETILDEYTTPNNTIVIDEFCVYDRAGNSPDCYQQSNRSLHVVYSRPDVAPFMSVYRTTGSGDMLEGDNYKRAEVIFTSNTGTSKTFVIESEGLIYVQN